MEDWSANPAINLVRQGLQAFDESRSTKGCRTVSSIRNYDIFAVQHESEDFFFAETMYFKQGIDGAVLRSYVVIKYPMKALRVFVNS